MATEFRKKLPNISKFLDDMIKQYRAGSDKKIKDLDAIIEMIQNGNISKKMKPHYDDAQKFVVLITETANENSDVIRSAIVKMDTDIGADAFVDVKQTAANMPNVKVIKGKVIKGGRNGRRNVQTGGNWKETIKLIFTMSLMVLTVMLFNNITVDRLQIDNAITRMNDAMGSADEQHIHVLIEAVTMLRTLEPGMGAFNYLLNAVGLGISGNVELVRHAPNPTGIIYFLISMMYLLFLTFMSQLSTPEPGTRTTRSFMSYIPSMPSSFTQFAHPRQPQQRVDIVPPPMPELTEPQDRTMPFISDSAIALANKIAPPLPDDTPEEFIDPITMELMKNPETLSDGSTFDHDTVQRWIFGDGKGMGAHLFNPLTRADVTAYVEENTVLKAKIDAWKKEKEKERDMQGGTRRCKNRNTKRRIQSKYKSKRYRRCKCKRSHRRNRMTRRT